MNIDVDFCKGILKTRDPYTSKIDYGHLLLVCGSRSMPGAALLATGSALHSGCGLVTLHSVENVCNAVSYNFPSAILSFDEDTTYISSFPDNILKYNVVAVGPGIGVHETAKTMLFHLITMCRNIGKRMLLDADALNILSYHKDWIELIPEGSIMTPHAGELGRLSSCSDKLEAAKLLASESKSVVVLKGYRTKIVLPNGDFMVNTTGGPGLAKGGSGDVLSGLISGLMSRGYETCDAASLGTWIHGYTGDILSKERSAEAFDSYDLISYLYKAFTVLYKL